MKTETISIKEFVTQYGAILDKVQNDKECRVEVTRDGRPWVVLKSPLLFTSHQLSQLEQMAGRQARKNLSTTLGMIHYQKQPLLIVRKGISAACIYPLGKD